MGFNPYRRVALRAWAPPVGWKPPSRSKGAGREPGDPFVGHALIFDTETTTDEAQALLFGAYRYVKIDHRLDGLVVTTVGEGLAYADDLPTTDPDAFRLLQDYARTHTAQVDMGYLGAQPSWRLNLHSRDEFTRAWLYHVGYPHNDRTDPAVITGFNLPFDLSRIATDVTEARGDLRGGFSFILWVDDHGSPAPFRPWLGIKNLDSKRALMKLRKVERGKNNHTGHLLDLRSLTYALTGTAHSLDSACHAFGVAGKAAAPEFGLVTTEAIDYCREDVAATTRLLQATLVDFAKHPIDLLPTRAYSAASIAKNYLHAMGITPRLEVQPDFPPEILGASMSAYYGGRAEVHIRHVPLPVQLVDFTSMYPTVDALLGIWDLVTAQTVTPVEATNELQALLDSVTLEDLYAPTLWPRLVAIAEIIPDCDELPIRADYTPTSYSIGINRLDDHQHAYWYTLADLIASKQLTGRAPRLQRGIRFEAEGRQSALSSVQLRGTVTIDPTTDDFFTRVVEERQRHKTQGSSHDASCWCESCALPSALKVLANSGSYGIYGEMIRQDRPGSVTVYTGREAPFKLNVAHPETPGAYCFPPIAAAITGAARLMLTMLEREVTDRGGSWVFCDTDSMAIVATDSGGQLYSCPGGDHGLRDGTPAVKVLSYDEVDEIRAKFNRLNPYDQQLVPDILKREAQGTCLAISAKRYAIYDQTPDGDTAILKASEHGLGRYLAPTHGWVHSAWRWIIDAHHKPDAQMPAWAAQPALSRITVTSPILARAFSAWNHDKGWGQRIKPFNFITVVDLDPFGLPEGAKHDAFRLIAPYGGAGEVQRQRWRNLYSNPATEHPITTDRDTTDDTAAVVKTLDQVVREYRLHPEHKFNTPDGRPCGRTTAGVLQRRTVRAVEVTYIGKEANRIDDVQSGLIADVEGVVQSYATRRNRALRELGLPVLVHLSSRRIAEIAGVDRRTVDRIKDGQEPRPELHRRLMQLAVDVASDGLGLPKRPPGISDESLLMAWLDITDGASATRSQQT